MLVSLQVSKTKIISPAIFENHFGKKYNNPLKKGMYFLFIEGPNNTIRKYRSKVIERKIERDQVIVIALIVMNHKSFVGITRALGNSFTFNTKLIYQLQDQASFEDIVLSKSILNDLESYLPVSSCPLPEKLSEKILNENSFLKPIDDEQILLFSCQRHENKSFIKSTDLKKLNKANPRVYLIGFGGYAREYILPNFRDFVGGAVDYKAELINRYLSVPFPVYPSLEDILESVSRTQDPLVIISNHHSDHASTAIEILQANPNAKVFIEKPAVVELSQIDMLIDSINNGSWIDIGYNRRYAFFSKKINLEIHKLPSPKIISILVKEIKLPDTHWYFWPNQGTRITGNLCHWIDLVRFFSNANPKEVTLLNTGDSVSVNILFTDGSLAIITATDKGDDLQGVEEFIEIRAGQTSISLNDYRKLVIRSESNFTTINKLQRDKGHSTMYKDLKMRWLNNGKPMYAKEDLYWVSYLTCQVTNMYLSGQRSHNIGQ